MDGSVQERPGVGVVGVVLLLCLLSFAVHIKMPSVCLRRMLMGPVLILSPCLSMRPLGIQPWWMREFYWAEYFGVGGV